MAEADGAPLTSQFLSKQSKMASVARSAAHSAAARQRLEPITITSEDEPGDLRADLRTTSPLEGVPTPVKPEPASRMQVSYSTSPPPPHWPAPAPVETKVVEVIEKTPEARSLFEQESRLRTRIPGLSAYQQRVAQIAASMTESSDERDFTSLSDSINQDLRPGGGDPPSLPVGLGLDPGLTLPVETYKEVLKHFDDEINTLSLTQSEETFSGTPDSLEPSVAPEKPQPPQPPSVGSLVSLRRPSAKGKSSSLESIESYHRPSAPSPPALTRQKASSSESITHHHGHGQVTISITRRVEAGEGVSSEAASPEPASPEAANPPHCVTVACVPDPEDTPSLSVPLSLSACAQPQPQPSPTCVTSTPMCAVTLVNLSSSPPDKPDAPCKPEPTTERPDKREKTEIGRAHV